MKTRKVSKSRAQHIMEELFYYKLVFKKDAWNNKLIVLTTQSFKFFQDDKAPNKYSIGHLLKRSYFIEHYLDYGLDRLPETETLLLSESILKPDHIKELEIYKFMQVESVETTVSGGMHITFAFLNYQKTVSPIALESRVKYINAILPMDRDITFSIRVCNYDASTNTLCKRRWQPHKFNTEASYHRFKGFNFTSLGIRKHFEVTLDKYEVIDND
ncbi:hypothetical protein [Fusibacter tunisiensis]|nr:hypothetical protein [Fusibacter tunisiensis]